MSSIQSRLPGTDTKVGVYFLENNMAYVYGHYKKDTGELFYIGKGTGKRAWATQHRTTHWYNVVNKHGVIVKIIEDDLTEEEALASERKLISEIGLENLVNILEGGEGVTSEYVKSQFLNEDYKNRHKNGLHLARDKMSQIKKRQLIENPQYLKKIIEVLQNPETREKRYEKVECDVCGQIISKNVLLKHKQGHGCRKEFMGLTNREINCIRNREKYRRKVNLLPTKYRVNSP